MCETYIACIFKKIDAILYGHRGDVFCNPYEVHEFFCYNEDILHEK